MSVFTKSIVTVAALLASVSIAAPAQAVVVFNFNFTAPIVDGGPIATGRGTITTADPVSGQYRVLSATGTFFNGENTRAITNVFGFVGADVSDAFLFKVTNTAFATNSIVFSDSAFDPAAAFPGVIFNFRQGFVYAGLANDQDFAGGTLNLAPVPEPATWAMMLVGFAGIGIASRRKRAALAVA